MASNEFKNIEEFIKRFNTPRFCYDTGVDWICGIEFSYKNKYYRITKEQSGDDDFTKKLKEKFNKANGNIEFYNLPIKKYMDDYDLTLDIYLGLYDNVEDLLNNGNIDGVPLKEILVSDKTTVLGID